MAREIPVLPLVGSRMVQPGRKVPFASAARIICRAARSFTEPVGLRSSSFAHNRTSPPGDSRGNPTRGVWPTESAKSAYRVTWWRSAAGDRREHDHDIAVGRGRAEATVEAYVFVVDVHVHELTQASALDETVLEAGMPAFHVVDHLKQVRSVTLDALRPARERTQNRRDPYLYYHRTSLFSRPATANP